NRSADFAPCPSQQRAAGARKQSSPWPGDGGFEPISLQRRQSPVYRRRDSERGSASKIKFAPDLYGSFSVKWFFGLLRFLVWSGKAVPRPVACDQVRGARGRVSRDRNASAA